MLGILKYCFSLNRFLWLFKKKWMDNSTTSELSSGLFSQCRQAGGLWSNASLFWKLIFTYLRKCLAFLSDGFALFLICKFLTQDNKILSEGQFTKLLHHPKFCKALPFCYVLCSVWKKKKVLLPRQLLPTLEIHYRSFWLGFYLHMLQTALLLNRLLVVLPVTELDGWCENSYNFLIPGNSGHEQLCIALYFCVLLALYVAFSLQSEVVLTCLNYQTTWKNVF